MGKFCSMRNVMCLFWLLLTGTGFAFVLKYENTPGTEGQVTGQWPAETRLKLDNRRPTLIIFAHPRCPCTRATMEELNRLLARSQGQVRAQVCFFQPENASNGWSHSDLWRSASALPGVTVHTDAGGREARLHGSETSGSTILYAPDGKLLFKGGITSGRGHAGDNAGENAILALLNGKAVSLQQTPVYGCSLLGSRGTVAQ